MKRIILTGGGTAGHVTPNLALIPKLEEEGYEILYIGSKKGIEKDLIQKAGVDYKGISSGKLRRYFDLKNFTDPFRVIAGYFQAAGIIRKFKPDVIFSKGGFVAVPVVLAAGFKAHHNAPGIGLQHLCGKARYHVGLVHCRGNAGLCRLLDQRKAGVTAGADDHIRLKLPQDGPGLPRCPH